MADGTLSTNFTQALLLSGVTGNTLNIRLRNNTTNVATTTATLNLDNTAAEANLSASFSFATPVGVVNNIQVLSGTTLWWFKNVSFDFNTNNSSLDMTLKFKLNFSGSGEDLSTAFRRALLQHGLAGKSVAFSVDGQVGVSPSTGNMNSTLTTLSGSAGHRVGLATGTTLQHTMQVDSETDKGSLSITFVSGTVVALDLPFSEGETAFPNGGTVTLTAIDFSVYVGLKSEFLTPV